MPSFTPPSVSVRKSRLHTINEGETLLRESGVWSLVRFPTDDRVSAAERAYRGGYVYDLTDEECAEIPEAYGGPEGEPT